MALDVIKEKLAWRVSENGEQIGSFWHGDGQFWWSVWCGPDAMIGKSFPPEITETAQMIKFVYDQHRKTFKEKKSWEN